jgi:glycosyltransferase involved in cell wall biosynthesis
MTTDAPRREPLQTSLYPFISIVMPCLNEKETVEICVRKGLGWLERTGNAGEVIVVDNGSDDGSPELAAHAGAIVVHEAVRGYGAALRRGFREARGEWLVMGDCDDTYDFSDLDALMAPLATGTDMVVGNRHDNIKPGAMTWSHRYIGTPVISMLLRMFTGLKVGDSQCGLRSFTRDALNRMDLHTDGMELASEMVLKAARRDLKVSEVGITYDIRLGEAKLNTFRDGWRHLRFLLLASPNYLFTIPGLILTLLGVLTLGASVPSESIEIGSMSWQPVFAGSILTVVGVNAILLGFTSRLHTLRRGMINEDHVLRFYKSYLGLEAFIMIGIILVLGGLAMDVVLAVAGVDGTGNLNYTALAAIAQTLIIIGVNAALVGFITSIIEGD